MVLDTGAAVTIVNPGILRRIGLEPSASARSINLTTADSNLAAPLVQPVSIEFLGILLKAPVVAAHNLPPNAKVDGLLGTDMLRNLILTIDFESAELEIRSKREV